MIKKKEFQIDTEIINTLFNKNLSSATSINQLVDSTLNELKGTYSIASYFGQFNAMLLATNNGSLYYVTDHKTFLFFASEEYYYKRLKKSESFQSIAGNYPVMQLDISDRLWIDLSDFSIKNLKEDQIAIDKSHPIKITKHLVENKSHRMEMVIDPATFINRHAESHLFNSLEYNVEAIRQLKRCTKCVLPETFPFIKFDEKGDRKKFDENGDPQNPSVEFIHIVECQRGNLNFAFVPIKYPTAKDAGLSCSNSAQKSSP
jgi:hypothetical protein